ncbi:translocation/assembly module TamB domain-containing protein [Phenylobacterium sp.]|uniref:translocation/assembly module TamB domain-containing protein n=1 Tax=Phenylobacterium sp. TaxID=1871053 RepID=UPI00286CFA7E|nr:translocation/assembly module TamB domain-containing protein [Phenylobacterium sp.]
MNASGDSRAVRRLVLIEVIVLVVLAILGGAAVLLLGARYGVLLPQARVLIEAGANGLKVGRLGRLQIEGLSGDIWRDVGVKKLTIRDEGGVWLEADNIRMRWRYVELLTRNFHADSLEVETLKVLRRPTLTAKGKDSGLPLSFHIDRAHARVELLPAFSLERGVYDLTLNLDAERGGDVRGKVRAASVLRTGDHLYLDYDVARARPLAFLLDAEETRGGALAGALGLAANQAFTLKVVAGGKMSDGRFGAVVGSGRTEPLRAQGDWTKAGGETYGRLSLTASTLTAPYAGRFGPDLRFVLAGRRAGADLFALDGRLAAANLTLRATGLGDIGARRIGPLGLAITAETTALSRITNGPDMGLARIVGRLTQVISGWRFAGSGAVSRLGLGGYALAQATGPIEARVRDRQWDLKATLTGAGGGGPGYLAAVLGGAPRMSLDGARLADGRLLLRDLKLTGAGLKLAATGERGLLGGLTFKGTAAVSNLAAARVGAAGSAQASWAATQGRAGQPWILNLEARGDKLASGYAEIDRLLGARPELKVQASLQQRRLAVGSASLVGAAARASAAGVLAADGGLAFKLDWSADGPFRAGPVEISGRTMGAGAVTGSLGAPRADILADVDAIDLPGLPLKAAHVTLSFLRGSDGFGGMIAATATSAYGPARARSDFRFPGDGVDLTGLSVDAGGIKASGSLSLRGSAASAANLDLAVTRGAFLDAGRVAGAVRIIASAGPARATVSLVAENARPIGSTAAIQTARFSAEGPADRLPYLLQAQGASQAGRWSLEGRGALSDARPGVLATFDGAGRLGGRDLRTVETARLGFGGPERGARLRLRASDGGRIDLDAALTDTAANIRAAVSGLGLGMLDEDLSGKTDATLTLQGRGGRLDGALEAKLVGARGRGAPVASGIDGVIHGRLADSSLALDLSATNAQGLNASATVVLPTEVSAAPFRVAIARQQPMRGRFSAQGEVRPLWDLLVGGERSLAGMVRSHGTLGGTLAKPSAAGQIAVDSGRFDDGATGLSLRNVALAADFTQDTVTIARASALDGRGGTLAGMGRISLARDGASSLKLDLKRFRLIDNELASASATGQASIDRAADGKVRLSGTLAIDRADVAARLPTPSGVVTMPVTEKNRPPELAAALPSVATGGEGWALDVTLKTPRGVFLRGRGLDVELSLDAHVGGTTAHPDLTGQAHVVRGDYDFAGKRFAFDPRSVVYLSTRAEAVRLDLTATRDDPALTADVRIRGTAARPEITVTSTPSLPDDEILSQVLFGRTASQLAPLEAAQLASALAALAGGGGFDVIGNLRTFAGLDRLALGGGNASGVTVSGGKYLTDNVYLELTGGGRDGGAAQVEWRVKKNLSIISRLGGQGAGRLAIRWRRDY